jgi:hypothetical protein
VTSNGQKLPREHPLHGYESPQQADCIADIPERILNQLVLYYNGEEPEGEPVPNDEELV